MASGHAERLIRAGELKPSQYAYRRFGKASF